MNHESPLSPYFLSQICSVEGFIKKFLKQVVVCQKVLSHILPELAPIKEPRLQVMYQLYDIIKGLKFQHLQYEFHDH